MSKKYTVSYRKAGEEKKGSFLMVGTFLLGPLWLLICGMWGPALVYTALALFTFFLSLAFPLLFLALLFLPFFTGRIVRKFYLENGWEEVTDGKTLLPAAQKAPTALEQAQIELLKAQTEAIRRGEVKKAAPEDDDDVPTYRL